MWAGRKMRTAESRQTESRRKQKMKEENLDKKKSCVRMDKEIDYILVI